MKIWSLPAIALTFTIAISAAAADLESGRTKYKPYPHDFPQVIQAFDYGTIQFIESMYAALRELGPGEITCEVGKGEVTFSSTAKRSQQATLKRTQRGDVEFNGQEVTHKDAVQLCSTLLLILSDLSAVRGCLGIALDQFATRAYNRRTVLEFNFGSLVVVIDSFSNGPDGDERLYVLDLIDPSESFFFAKPRATRSR